MLEYIISYYHDMVHVRAYINTLHDKRKFVKIMQRERVLNKKDFQLR